jgi:hypothetical protein
MRSNAVFISYRRSTGGWIARAVHDNLRANQVDSFLDLASLAAGEFREAIDAQIRTRPYFVPIFAAKTLERCREPGDVLLAELAGAVDAQRRIVPLVTTEFDRGEISACLPKPLATRYLGVNSITVDLEYFEPAMDKLRDRFLLPVDMDGVRGDPALDADAQRLLAAAAAAPPLPPVALRAQMHMERALMAADGDAARAAEEFQEAASLLAGPGMAPLMPDFDLAYLDLQARIQRDSRNFEAMSKMMKTKHDLAKAVIDSIGR